MSKVHSVVASVLCLAVPVLAEATSIDAMRDQRCILVVSAPTADDRSLQTQRADIARWPSTADRNLSTVQIVGNQVEGTSDAAGTLRARFDLPKDRFVAILVGKNGQIALRFVRPVDLAKLNETIAAMPMAHPGL